MNTNLALLVTLTASLAATRLAAQDTPAPAPELKKYEVLAGAFTGEGTLRMTAGGEAMPWTSTSTGQWILGGHILEERMNVVVGGGAMVIEFRSFFGWDGETGRHVNLGVSNMGPVALDPVHFLSANEFVVVAARSEQGHPVADHGAYQFHKDGYTFALQRIDTAGKAFEHVRGTFKRVKTDAASHVAEASFQGEATGELTKLSRLLGSWNVTGKMIPVPGMTAIPISGKETSRLGFGGTVIVGHVNGDPIPGMGPAYEEWSFMTFDAEAKKYVHGYINNMGLIGVQNGQAVGDDVFVFTNAAPMMGSPSASRTTLDFSSGSLQVASDRFSGAGPAVREFEGSYKRAK